MYSAIETQASRQSYIRWVIGGILFFGFLLFAFVFVYTGAYELFTPTKEVAINKGIEDHPIEFEGLAIHYRTLCKKDQQPVIFIHGWGGPYENRDQVTTALHNQEFCVFTLEVPGLDRSTTPNEPWSNDQYVEYFKKVIATLNIEKPIIIGQSFGGGVAASYAKLYPDEIRYLVLVDANTTDKDFLYPKLIKLLGDTFSSTLKSSLIPTSFKNLFIKNMLTVPDDALNASNHVERSVMGETFILTHTENQFEKLEHISTPTILIWGESDRKVPVGKAKLMDEKLVNSTLVTLPGGHTVIYKDPEAVAKILKAEVEKLDVSSRSSN